MARLPLVWAFPLLILALFHPSSGTVGGTLGGTVGGTVGGTGGGTSDVSFHSTGNVSRANKENLSSVSDGSAGHNMDLSNLVSGKESVPERSLVGDMKVNLARPRVLSVKEILERDAEVLSSTATRSQKPRKYKKYSAKNKVLKKHASRKRVLDKSGGAIARHWGVPDASAVVGKQFRLNIHRNAFKGDIGGYEVSGLPPWLSYTPGPPSIRGTAPQAAWGTVWYVRVTAVPPAGLPAALGATDTFAVTVVSPDELGHHPRPRRSPDYAPGEYPEYNNYEYEYDEYDPTYPDYSGTDSEVYDEVPPHVASTPVYGVTASTVTMSLPRPPSELPPAPLPRPQAPTDVVQPSRVVVEASPTAPTPVPTTTTTPPPHHHFRPIDPTQPTVVVEPTRTLAPSPPATVTEPLPPPASPSTPPPPPDVTDHLVRNFPPDVTSRMSKLAWVGGFVYRLRVPEDTFQDLEDGGTRNLRLVLLNSDQSQLSPNSWLQFDPVRQEIYALPLEDLMGHYVFLLEAIDSGGKSVQETLKIHVQQPKQARNFLHRYTATLRIAKKYEYDFKYSLDWQVSAVQKIASLFNNRTDSINVRSISDNPTKITWTNVTLVDPLSTECPTAAIDYMNQVLFGVPEPPPQQTEPLREVEEHFKPEFHLKRLHVHYTSHCDQRHYTPHGVSAPAPNTSPRFLNQIDIVNATAGQLYRRQVPQDACYDLEDGNSRNLRLRLLTYNLARLPPQSWLQFDTNNQEFYGLPLAGDVGTAEYTLECVDSGGSKTNDALKVVVNPSLFADPHAGGVDPAPPQPPASFSLTLRHDYDSLMATPLHKMALVERIGRAFGDEDGRQVSVWALAPGSVVVRWYNTSLPGAAPCPSQRLNALHHLMLTPQGTVRPEFAAHFLPEFEVAGGDVTPGGACLAPDTPPHTPPPDLGTPDDPFGFDDLKESGVAGERPTTSSSGEDYLLTFLIPSVLMAAMLVLAAVAACCLYRHRRRYAKMSLTSHAAPPDTTTTFVTTGIPVILAEELDDHPSMQGSRSPAAKTPVIMKDEKPPLPPYRQSPPSPHNPHQQYQQPPPPFTNGSSPRNTSLPSQPPAYRKPTYMPP